MIFNKQQLHQMLECAEYVDEVFVDLRKGKAQTRYIVKVSPNARYYNLEKESICEIDEDLIGYWMQEYKGDNYYDSYKCRLEENYGWVKCESIEVVSTVWREALDE